MTGESAFKAVTELIRRHQREIWTLQLQVDGQPAIVTFETTDDHPWRTEAGGWLATQQLTPGMRIQRAAGPPAMVVSVALTERLESTYNLEVADFHTYFVGEAGVWVHNACKIDAAKSSGTRPGDLPARGPPNSSASVDKGDGKGTIRDYGPDGRAKTDYDFGHDHPTPANPKGAGDPHAHDWDWSKQSRERQPPRPLRPGE